MDPNNNQPMGTNPIAQPTNTPMPVEATPVVSAPTPSTPPQQIPKGKNSKFTILLLIVLLLVTGIVAYALFAKNQMNTAQKETTENSNTVLPTPTLVPTLAPEEDLEVASPEADLLDIEVDVKGL